MTYWKKATLKSEFFAVQIVFLVFVIVSSFFRHRGLSFFDASDYATAIQGWGIPHAPGYPLYVILGKFFNLLTHDPFEAQFWLNIAAAWGACYFLYKTLAANRWAAVLAVFFLLSQYLFQQYILVPEVFTLNLTMATALIYFHQRFDEELHLRWCFGIGLVYGLAFCHHHLMALMVPASIFLLIRGFMKSSWVKGLGLAIAGFAIGLLPLIYFFVAGSMEADYTYFAVHDISDLLFVVLRKGYGTFKMTGTGGEVSAANLLSVIFFGMAKSTYLVGILGAIVAWPFYWRAKKPVSASAVLTTSTVIIFLVLFCTLANFPIETREGQNAFIRYLSFPNLLILYPLAYGWQWLAARWGRWFYSAGYALAFAAAGFSFAQLNYSHYPVIDFQIGQGFRTIERVMDKTPDNIDPRYMRCVIFALTDPFHFGGRYYNEFQAKPRCYFYSIATVITGQFQSRAEEQLMKKVLGLDYDFTGKSRETVMLDFFARVLKTDYRLFFMYSGDLEYFGKPDLIITPVGNILEIVNADKKIPPESIRLEYVGYLENLKVLLTEMEQAPIQPDELSATSAHAPFANLQIYSQLMKLTPPYSDLETDIRRRSEKLMQH